MTCTTSCRWSVETHQQRQNVAGCRHCRIPSGCGRDERAYLRRSINVSAAHSRWKLGQSKRCRSRTIRAADFREMFQFAQWNFVRIRKRRSAHGLRQKTSIPFTCSRSIEPQIEDQAIQSTKPLQIVCLAPTDKFRWYELPATDRTSASELAFTWEKLTTILTTRRGLSPRVLQGPFQVPEKRRQDEWLLIDAEKSDFSCTNLDDPSD